MNNINMLNVPSNCRSFCLVNYNADSEVTDCNGKRNFVDLPLLEPIFARSLEEAKEELAKRINVPVSALSEWECVGEEDGFCPSICTGYKFGAFEAGYSFDVYTTVNTLHLV
jgi:hypothetical protein